MKKNIYRISKDFNLSLIESLISVILALKRIFIASSRVKKLPKTFTASIIQFFTKTPSMNGLEFYAISKETKRLVGIFEKNKEKKVLHFLDKLILTLL